jgi:hypothetical protein
VTRALPFVVASLAFAQGCGKDCQSTCARVYEPAQCGVQGLAPCHGAAGAVDRDHQGAHGIVGRGALQRLQHAPVLGDEARDRQAQRRWRQQTRPVSMKA